MADIHHAAAREEDVLELFKQMRPRDYDEVEAAAGDVALTLSRVLVASDDPITLRDDDGELIAVYGVSPTTLMGDTASPWLLGTSRMERNAKAVLRDARRYIAFVSERYPRLVNYVDARNKPSIRWLRRVGFQIDPPAPYGVAGLPFHRFHKGIEPSV